MMYCFGICRPTLVDWDNIAFKVEDEFRSGMKSSCCGNNVLMELCSIDCRHITLTSELIM